LHYCTLEGESAESARQKNDVSKRLKWKKIFYICPKLPKMDQKFCYLSQRTQRKQNCTYIKNARETFCKKVSKVPVQIFIKYLPRFHRKTGTLEGMAVSELSKYIVVV